MNRFVLTTMALLTGAIGVASTAHAQPPYDGGRFYAELTAGPTFGHKSSGSIGAEAGYWLVDMFGVYVEGGHIGNAATADIEDKGALIASALGTTADVKQSVNYFDAGLVARWERGRVSPMAFIGIGGARVTNKTDFGTALGSEVQLGSDLDGHYSKALFVIGVGARYSIARSWFADLSYRYGGIGANSEFELERLNTNRLQFGFGRSF